MADVGAGQGVWVNAINPGLIETDRFSRNIARVSTSMAARRAHCNQRGRS
jgi:NAD(P)-dependent dehydrogenase (short-subunit alcohol dehydrogenase family)